MTKAKKKVSVKKKKNAPGRKADPSREKLKLVNFKTSQKERAVLKRMAVKYTRGVVSEYLRLVATNPEYVRLPKPSKRLKLAA